MKVIGAGLGRTGTMSLKFALEHLYNAPSFHMIELLRASDRLKYLKKAAKGQKEQWQNLLEGYATVVDYPCCLYYKELMEVYPEAKVVLTSRDFDSWYESAYKTIYKGKPKSFRDIARLVKNVILHSDMRKVAPIFKFADQIIWDGQFEKQFENKEYAIQKHREYIEEVKRHVPRERLLIYEVKEGWKPLCDFLELPIPEIPFPRSNSQEEFIAKMDTLIYEGKLVF